MLQTDKQQVLMQKVLRDHFLGAQKQSSKQVGRRMKNGLLVVLLCNIGLLICEKEQQIVDKSLLGLDQYDDRLSKALLEKIIVHPSKLDELYNFTKPIHRLELQGQFEQPIIINRQIFKNRIKNGFFIEAGAYDGEAFSNSLFYELKLNWTGILVEANPDAFKELKSKHRKSWLLGHCLSTQNQSEIVDFDASGLLGGIIHQGKKPGVDQVSGDVIKSFGGSVVIPGAQDLFPYQRRTIQTQCFPLYSILKAIGNPTVHYFSLDVEGSELPILKTIPFDKVDIKVLDIEIKNAGQIFPGSYREITKFMYSQGYEFFTQVSDVDAIYVKKGYLNELNEL